MSFVNLRSHNSLFPRQYGAEADRFVDRASVGAKRSDVGDQALMRGLDTAGPNMRLGRSLSYGGRRSMTGHKAVPGVPLPGLAPADARRCARRDERQPDVRRNCPADVTPAVISRPTAHRKPASSRATAVTATVDLFPLVLKAR